MPKEPEKRKSNVIRLSSVLEDGMLWNPEQLFADSQRRAAEEFPERKKALALFYDPQARHVSYSQCGMSLTEIIRVLSQLHDELMFDLIEANL